jgi:hypothetical protein
MAKRSRRSRSRIQAAPATPAAPVTSKVVESAPPAKEVDFIADYRYVYYDMRMMLVITVSMVILMIGLSYII